MKIDKDELATVLTAFNPWWRSERPKSLPPWQRAAFGEIQRWLTTPPTHRAVLLSGARQVGKTTLVLQAITDLLNNGIPASNILYATFDHPIIRLAGIEATLHAWRNREIKQPGIEYLFLDEAQCIRDWGTWLKHQVDFNKERRIVFTGSATPLLHDEQESGVGRWHTIRLTTLSFYEYLRLKNVTLPELPEFTGLQEMFSWTPQKILKITTSAAPYLAHFHDYLLRGGFPQTAVIEDIDQAQRLLREDIVDKVLKRDMTAMFGVRRVLELEHLFLYLCRHDGGILDFKALCSNLEINRTTALHFLDLLEAAHLLYRLNAFGYGKEVLRGKQKVFLADAAIAPAVMLQGKALLDNPTALGVAAEAAVLRHLFARLYPQNVRFSYWREKTLEVDLVAETGKTTIPFEIKYKSRSISRKDVLGLIHFCTTKQTKRGYIATQEIQDFGVLPQKQGAVHIMRIPAALLCYWMGEHETKQEQKMLN